MLIKFKNVIKAEKRLKQLKNQSNPKLVDYIELDEFSDFIHRLLISDGGYVIDVGDCRNVNYICAHALLKRVKKHPLIWKLFFMIA